MFRTGRKKRLCELLVLLLLLLGLLIFYHGHGKLKQRLYYTETPLFPFHVHRNRGSNSRSNDSCLVQFTQSKVTNFTSLKHIIKKFIPDQFSPSARDFCWSSHLDLSSLPNIHNLAKAYTHYELPVSEVSRRIHKITSGTNPLNITCLPSIHILGFPKCGSTYLYDILSKHPDMRPAKEKEPHFWTKFPFENPKYDTYSFLAYLANFSGKNKPLPHSIRRSVSILDSSQSTIWNTENTGDLCAVPRLLQDITPNAKFIVIMRDPVDQLYSDFWHFTLSCHNVVFESTKQRIIKRTFLTIVNREMKRLKKCMVSGYKDECLHYILLTAKTPFNGCKKLRLGVNIYSVYIKRWLKFFRRDQFLFLRLEDMASDPYQVFDEVWSFLGIQNLSKEEFEKIVSATPRTLSNYPPLEEKSRKMLEKFYAPYNADLAHLLNDTSFLWN